MTNIRDIARKALEHSRRPVPLIIWDNLEFKKSDLGILAIEVLRLSEENAALRKVAEAADELDKAYDIFFEWKGGLINQPMETLSKRHVNTPLKEALAAWRKEFGK